MIILNKVDSKFLTKKNEKGNKNLFIVNLNKIMFCIIIFLLFLIIVKANPSLKDKIYNKVFNTNFSFSSINKWCKEKFGSILPDNSVSSPKENNVLVFNDKLNYSSSEKYKDGVRLNVSNNYLVPVLESGTVVYIGDKELYGKTIIIQQVNGVDVWYSNINNYNVKLYDYVEKGSYLCETKDNYLYLVFQKNGEYLDYKEYI